MASRIIRMDRITIAPLQEGNNKTKTILILRIYKVTSIM
jgi:hypothetical protein